MQRNADIGAQPLVGLWERAYLTHYQPQSCHEKSIAQERDDSFLPAALDGPPA